MTLLVDAHCNCGEVDRVNFDGSLAECFNRLQFGDHGTEQCGEGILEVVKPTESKHE